MKNELFVLIIANVRGVVKRSASKVQKKPLAEPVFFDKYTQEEGGEEYQKGTRAAFLSFPWGGRIRTDA